MDRVLERGIICLEILSPLNRVNKNLEAVPVLLGSQSCPQWMLCAPNMALRVGHQGKNTPRSITNTSDITCRPVGVIRITGVSVSILVGVIQDYIQIRQGLRSSYHLALAMSHREIQVVYASGKYAGALAIHPQMHPPTFKFTRIIGGQGY